MFQKISAQVSDTMKYQPDPLGFLSELIQGTVGVLGGVGNLLFFSGHVGFINLLQKLSVILQKIAG
ncbi:MAG: hypothetical protein AAF765_09495 [Bacteroidota bacterium]